MDEYEAAPAPAEEAVHRSVDRVLARLLQGSLLLTHANGGMQQAVMAQAELLAWLEARVQRAQSKAEAHAQAERQAVEEQAAALVALAAAKAARHQQKPQKVAPAGAPSHAASPPTKQPAAVPVAALSRGAPLAPVPMQHNSAPTVPVSVRGPTPVAGSTTGQIHEAARGRRQYPHHSAQVTLLSDADRAAAHAHATAQQLAFDASQWRAAEALHGETDAILTPHGLPPAPRPHDSPNGPLGMQEEPPALFGMPKKLDKSKLLSPYLQSQPPARSSSRPKVKAVAPRARSGSTTRSSPPASSPPPRPPVHNPVTSPLAPLSLDAILAQARHVHAADDEPQFAAAAAPKPTRKPSSAAAATSSSRPAASARSSSSFVPSAAMATTAASAAKQRKPPTAAVPEKRWNSYGAATKSLAELALSEMPQPSSVAAPPRKRPPPSSHASTAAFQVRHSSDHAWENDSPAPTYTGHYASPPPGVHSRSHSLAAEPTYSVPSLRVIRSTALGDSIPYSVLMQHSPAHPPPPPPPPPAIPAPQTVASGDQGQLRFPPAFLATMQRFQAAQQRIGQLEQRRQTEWATHGPSWQTAELAFAQNAALQSATVDDSAQPDDSIAAAESHRQICASVLASTGELPPYALPSSCLYPAAPFAPLFSWLPEPTSSPAPGASCSRPALASPFSKVALSTLHARLLAGNKLVAQKARRSTLGLEPSQQELDRAACGALERFEAAKVRLLGARLQASLEHDIGSELAPLLHESVVESTPTRTLLPLLRLAYACLHVGGRSGPRDRHHQPRKAMPTFLPLDPTAQHAHAKPSLWRASDEARLRDGDEESRTPSEADDNE